MPLHKVALFLNPKFKSMAALGNPEREEVIALPEREEVICSIKCLLQILKMPACVQRNDHTYAPPPSKIPRQFSTDDEFDEWQDISGTRSDEHEVDRYKTIVFEESDTNKFLGETHELDLFKFWSSASMKEKFPRLSCVALGVLSIPASSASSERAFSSSGNTITKKRSRLSSSTVDALLVLNSKFRSEENKCLISL